MVKDFSAKLVTKRHLAENVWELTFEVVDDTLEFQPGQYLLLKIGDQFRQYSISSSPQDTKKFSFTVGYFPGGLASEYFDKMQEGDVAEFKGPAGVFILRNTGKDKIFLVTGTGIAPVKSMIHAHIENDHSGGLYLLFGEKTRDAAYYYDELLELSEGHEDFDFDICLSREENLEGLDENHYAIGRVNQVFDVYLEESGRDINDFEYYLCGSQKVVESLKEHLMNKGVQKENLFFENFG